MKLLYPKTGSRLKICYFCRPNGRSMTAATALKVFHSAYNSTLTKTLMYLWLCRYFSVILYFVVTKLFAGNDRFLIPDSWLIMYPQGTPNLHRKWMNCKWLTNRDNAIICKHIWSCVLHFWKNSLLQSHLSQWNQYVSHFCASSGLKLIWNVPVTAPQRNPTLPWPDFHFSAKWDHRSPKPQVRWSFSKSAFALWEVRINNCIFLSHVSLIVLISLHPTPICIRHEALALAREGKMLLLVAWVCLVVPSTASSGGMVPLEIWCQANQWGLIRRPHFTRPCFVEMVQQDPS